MEGAGQGPLAQKMYKCLLACNNSSNRHLTKVTITLIATKLSFDVFFVQVGPGVAITRMRDLQELRGLSEMLVSFRILGCIFAKRRD